MAAHCAVPLLILALLTACGATGQRGMRSAQAAPPPQPTAVSLAATAVSPATEAVDELQDIGPFIVSAAGALQPSNRAIASRPVSFEEAAATVDFTIIQPTWLPSAGYQLWQVQLLGDQEVILYYRDTTFRPGLESPRDIAIHERRWSTIGIRGVPASLEEGSIDGRPAAFWSLTFPAPALSDGTVTRLMAAWERGDLFIEFNTAGISKEQLAQVAASLAE